MQPIDVQCKHAELDKAWEIACGSGEIKQIRIWKPDKNMNIFISHNNLLLEAVNIQIKFIEKVDEIGKKT